MRAAIAQSARQAGRRLTFVRKLALPAAALALLVLHLRLIVQAEGDFPLFAQPLTWIDFDTHYEQVVRVTDALARFGKHWVYDVQMLAGYPTGTVFDADNKAWELWTYALWRAGMPRHVAFNLFMIAAHLLVVPVLYASARLFRLPRAEALLAAALGLAIWFFDGMSRWSWYSGGVSFALTTYLFVLPLALFYRHLRTGAVGWLAPLTVVMAAGHLVHPSIFVMLVVPMTGLYIRHFRKLSRLRHAAIVSAALLVVAANAWWLWTAFRFAHYITDHDPFFIAGLSNLLTDWFQVILDPTTTGLIGNQTSFRLLVLAAAALMLVRWKNQRDDRLLPVALGVGFLAGLAYLGGYLWLFRQIQPYRNVVPAAFLATIPAASLAGEFVRHRGWRGMSFWTRSALALAALMAVPHLASSVLYFCPRLVPDLPTLPTGEVLAMGAQGFPAQDDFRHAPPQHAFDEVTQWVRKHDDGQGRVLVEWWVLGEYLAGRTNAQVLGGFRQRNMEHTAANLFKRYPEGYLPDADIAQYFKQYAVEYVIVTQERPYFENRSNLLELVTKIAPHRVYRTRVPVSYFETNQGTVQAEPNRLTVRGTDPAQDVVLRFHWLETLRCEPGCRIERHPLPDNEVGFIRVPAPHPADFEIVNAY